MGKKVCQKWKAEALYCEVAQLGFDFQVKELIHRDKITQPIAIHIAANSRCGFFQKDHGFETKLKFIPSKFLNGRVYYYLIQNQLRHHCENDLLNDFKMIFSKVPDNHKKYVFNKLLKDTQLSEKIRQQLKDKYIKKTE